MNTVLPFDGFLDVLGTKGYAVGMRERFALARLLERWDGTNRGEFRDALAALLGRNDAEVQGIRNLFDDLYRDQLDVPTALPAPAPTPQPDPLHDRQKAPASRPRLRWAWAAIGVVIVIGLVIVLRPTVRHADQPTAPPSAAAPPVAEAPQAPPALPDLAPANLPPPPHLPAPPSVHSWGLLTGVFGGVFLLALLVFWIFQTREARLQWLRRTWSTRFSALPGPHHFSLVVRGRSAGLARADIEDAATLLGRAFATEVPARELDVPRTVRLTLRHGLFPRVVFKQRRVAEAILVFQDVSQDMAVWRPKVERFLSDVARQGVALDRYYFDSDIRRVTHRPHRTPAAFDVVMRRRPDAPVLVISTGSALPAVLDQADDRWLIALRNHIRRSWLTPLVDVRLWPGELGALPIHVWPMTRAGVAQAAKELAGSQAEIPAVLKERIASEGLVSPDGIERMKRLASLVPYPTMDLLESLRLRFAPDVSDAVIVHLFAEAGSQVLPVLRLGDEELRRCLHAVRGETPQLEAAVRLAIVDTLRDSEPPAGSAAHLRWRTALSLQELVLADLQGADATRPIETLQELAQGPTWEETRRAARLVSTTPALSGQIDAALGTHAGHADDSAPPSEAVKVAGRAPWLWVWPGVREVVPAVLLASVVLLGGLLLRLLPVQVIPHVEDAYRLLFVPSGQSRDGHLEVQPVDRRATSHQRVDLYQEDRVFRSDVAASESIQLAAADTGRYYQVRVQLPQGNLALSNAVWVPSTSLATASIGDMWAWLAERFRQRLVDNAAQPEVVYVYLKGYLMLRLPEHLDKTLLGFLADEEWNAEYATDPAERAVVSKHFRALLDGKETPRPIALDQDVVTNARSLIQKTSLAVVIYQSIRADNLDGAAQLNQLGNQQVLRRKSGASLTAPVPQVYTKKRFQDIAAEGISKSVVQFQREGWVWGESRDLSSVMESPGFSAKVLDAYETDYIRFWQSLLDDLEAVPANSPAQVKENLAIISGPRSPLRGLLNVVDENTFFSPPGAQSAAAVSATDRLLQSGRKAIAVAMPGARITDHFAPIHALVAGAPGSAPLDGVLARLNDLGQKVPAASGVGGTAASNAQAVQSVQQAGQTLVSGAKVLPTGVGVVITEIANSAMLFWQIEAAKAAAVERINTAAAAAKKRNDDAAAYREVVVTCGKYLDGRYPFAPGATSDVLPADFETVFGASGLFATYFKNNLEGLVDTSRARWTFKQSSTGESLGISDAMLQPFSQARQIQEHFFASGQGMAARFTVFPLDLSKNASQFIFEADGNPKLDHRNQAFTPLAWKWPGPGPEGVAVTFVGLDGSRKSLTFQGPWALFRLLNAGTVQSPSPDQFRLTLSAPPFNATVEFRSSSVINPFTEASRTMLQSFRCDTSVVAGTATVIAQSANSAMDTARGGVPPAPPSNSGRVAGLVHEAQLAYLNGDPAKVVSLLSPLATDNTLSATARADVHAYLAVAFAYQSVLAARDDERQRLTSLAQAEWQTALAANPKYRWPDNLVAPNVLKILGVIKPPAAGAGFANQTEVTKIAAAAEGETPALEALLNRYADAWSHRNAQAIKALYPGVGDQKELQRNFDKLRDTPYTVDGCAISQSGRSAVAQCNCKYVSVDQAGREVGREQGKKTFTLEKLADGSWRIKTIR